MMALRQKLYVTVFEHDTPAGKLFDVVLLWAILLSVSAVILESVQWLGSTYGAPLHA